MMRLGLLVLVLAVLMGRAVAQDVPGIEICTVEKTMERRTSCLQSNIDFLQKTLTHSALERQTKLDAVSRDITALKTQIEQQKALVAILQKTVEQFQIQAGDKKPRDTGKDTAKDAAK